MKEQEIVEGNKLIAEFMGFKIQKISENEADFITPNGKAHRYRNINGDIVNWLWFLLCTSKNKDGLKFNELYDCLMPVYKKIVKLIDKIDNQDAIIIFNLMYERLGDGDDILEVYKYIVEFIKWYNSQPVSTK